MADNDGGMRMALAGRSSQVFDAAAANRAIRSKTFSITPNPATMQVIRELNDVMVSSYHDAKSDETFLECHICGLWDDHAADCFVPALTRWLRRSKT